MDNNHYKRFNYQSSAKDLGTFFKKTIGMHLFQIQQERNLTSNQVCRENNIKHDALESTELGKGCVSWFIINKLFNYYHVSLQLELVRTSNTEATIE